MYSKTISGALLGVNALIINVEVDISSGLPMFSMVGCPGSEVKESRERVWSALKNAGYPVPVARITVNLSPADIHKEGTAYDLPIAIGILESSGVIPPGCAGRILIIGELGLNGEIKPVRGVLPIVSKAAKSNIKECIVPTENVREGAVIPGITVRGASRLTDVVEFLRSPSDKDLPVTRIDVKELFEESEYSSVDKPDFSDVSGQESAKRAAVISAAGFHSMLMTGPPGVGKSLIAKRIPTILPPLSLDESLEVTAIYSVAGKLSEDTPLITKRGFQSPHHSITLPALLGGGQHPKPGAISLAHRSVLFLDEFTEFDKRVMESLRQPLEEHRINISRANYSLSYPADFLMICAMNPCPCGYYPDRNKCTCSEPVLKRYLSKVSGPILDRIDLCVEMSRVSLNDMSNKTERISSRKMRSQVMAAREIQKKRYASSAYRFNSEISGSDIDKYCRLDSDEKNFIENLYETLSLSLRSYHRILRVSRTIADLDSSEKILKKHILEAAGFRPNLEYWRNL